MRVIVAPDSFKGTHSAREVTTALARGVRDAGAEPVELPLADGGEGTVAAIADDWEVLDAPVTAPDGRTVTATFARRGEQAAIETAAASGLHLIDPDTIDAHAATSAGTGELLVAAARAGAREILLGAGGSGFSDGGSGALEAIDAAGGLGDVTLRVLCDVTVPYERCAEVFGPQKGADPETVERLTARLHEIAAALPRDPRGVPRTGAAGGLAGALWARHDAELVSGIDEVLTLLRFDEALGEAALVITGEGRLDDQSAQGKVIDGVVRWARARGVPVHAVVGQDDRPAPALDPAPALELASVHQAGDPDAMARVAREIVAAAR